MWFANPFLVNFVVLALLTCHLPMETFDFRHTHRACDGIYLAGHGGSVPDTSGDEVDKMDETMVPVDYAESGQIKDDEIFTEARTLFSCLDFI